MYEELMEQVVRPENATAAWKAVKRNHGAPGIDGMTVEQLRDHVRQHWETIRAKLLAGNERRIFIKAGEAVRIPTSAGEAPSREA